MITRIDGLVLHFLFCQFTITRDGIDNNKGPLGSEDPLIYDKDNSVKP